MFYDLPLCFADDLLCSASLVSYLCVSPNSVSCLVVAALFHWVWCPDTKLPCFDAQLPSCAGFLSFVLPMIIKTLEFTPTRFANTTDSFAAMIQYAWYLASRTSMPLIPSHATAILSVHVVFVTMRLCVTLFEAQNQRPQYLASKKSMIVTPLRAAPSLKRFLSFLSTHFLGT